MAIIELVYKMYHRFFQLVDNVITDVSTSATRSAATQTTNANDETQPIGKAGIIFCIDANV